MTTPDSRPCKACGRKLYFVRDVNGKIQPLDGETPVYVLTTDLYGQHTAIRAANSYVTHFATCPKASTFSKG